MELNWIEVSISDICFTAQTYDDGVNIGKYEPSLTLDLELTDNISKDLLNGSE